MRVQLQRVTNNMMGMPCHRLWRLSQYSVMRMMPRVLCHSEFLLKKLCYHPDLNDWTPKKSIFKLICILCLPQLKESLESIRLDACKTEIETIGCSLTRQGRLTANGGSGEADSNRITWKQ